MKRVLVLASVASMIDQFNIPNIELLLDMGFQVHVACNFKEGNTCSKEKIDKLIDTLKIKNVKCYQIDFARDIKHLGKNVKALWQVERLLEKNDYSFIHCHSPIGGVVGRIAGKKYNTKVIYTAHGFHFFKGAPIKNWLIVYPIEKWLSKYTDTLITINNEDYNLARNKFYANNIYKVPGVGVNVKKYTNCIVNKEQFRKKIGLSSDDFVILSVGELNDRKNHATIVKAISKLKNKKIKYLIVGKGNDKEKLNKLVSSLNMSDQVFLLGYRTDIPELCKLSDIFAFPSKREGLGLAAIEGMAAGLPLLSSNVNGINDYSIDGKTGFSCNPLDINGFSKGIDLLYRNKQMRVDMAKKCISKSLEFDINKVQEIMKKIYSSIK